jgi:hypothetical protein
MGMSTIRLLGRVDEHHRLSADVPSSVAAGLVEVTIVVPSAEEDDAGPAWADGVASEWAAGLADPREDIYTIADGEPVDAPR